MAIATLAEYKTWASLCVSTYDAKLSFLLGAVQEEMEDYTGRKFDTATFTEYHDGWGTDTFLVRNPPIGSITSIQVLSQPGDNPQAVQSSLYTYNALRGQVRIQPSSTRRFPYDSFGMPNMAGPQYGQYPNFTRGFQNLKIVYVGGYGSSPAFSAMPSSLKMAMFKCVSSEFSAADNGIDPNMVAEKIGDYSYSRGGSLALTTREMLYTMCRPFRRVSL